MDIRHANAAVSLNSTVKGNSPEAVDNAARQLESQFAKMMIGMMRQTAMGDTMFPGAASQFRDLYDRELANVLTRGQGLGLQPMIRAQLSGQPSPRAADAAKAYSLQSYRATPALNALRPPLQAPIPISGLSIDPKHPQAIPLQSGQASPKAQYTPSIDRATESAYAPSVPGTPEAFVAEMWPHAQRAAAELGVSPKALLAQAALETGWGRHMARDGQGRLANNLFGIKAGRSWQGERIASQTLEVNNGVARSERAEFRAYAGAEQSFQDYVNLLKSSPRYAEAVGQSSPRAFAQALQKAGYATDPSYAAKIAAIVNGPTLNRALASLDAGLPRSA